MARNCSNLLRPGRAHVAINADIYSLNSLNGFFEADGRELHFKFHQEENEADMAGEYYRAGLLAEAGLPVVDQPLHVSTEPGRQILVYRRRRDRRSPRSYATWISPGTSRRCGRLYLPSAAERGLIRVYLRTLHPISAGQSADEPIHRLFHERLADPDGPVKSAEDSSFIATELRLSRCDAGMADLSRLQFEVNGVRYRDTFGRSIRGRIPVPGARSLWRIGRRHRSWRRAQRQCLVRKWRAAGDVRPRLRGSHIPALLAEIKTTFHNVFAHPLWLYDRRRGPDIHRNLPARRRDPAGGNRLASRLIRREVLAMKRDIVWRPLLGELRNREPASADWRRIIRLALFLCPTLVMNLRAGATTHNPVSSLIGFAVAVMVGERAACRQRRNIALSGCCRPCRLTAPSWTEPNA